MITITSEYLKKTEIALLKRYCNYVLRKFLRPGLIRSATITIQIIKRADVDKTIEAFDLKDYGGWVNNEGILPSGKRKFSIVVDAARMNVKSKKPLVRLKRVMFDLAHELVHVKQYLNNELFDYADGKARFRGKIYSAGHSPENDELYYNSPWEIEAYGREQGLYKMFKTLYIEEQKEKEKK
jgi:hypothetical protein